MKRLYSSLVGKLNIDKSKKAGDARTQDYLAPAVLSPVYLHMNRICYDLNETQEDK